MTGDRLDADLDLLIDIRARQQALETHAKAVKGQVMAALVGLYRRTGAAQFRRPDGVVSLVAPSPVRVVEDSLAFREWCAANAPAALAAATGHSVAAGMAVRLVEVLEAAGVDPGDYVVADVDWQRAAANVEASDRGDRVVTGDGEVVPGVRVVRSDPTHPVVRPTSEVRDLARKRAEHEFPT